MSQFDSVSVIKKSNIYFEGRCISHSIIFSDGTKKTIGVILPSTLTFNTASPEVMEIISGKCLYRVGGESQWRACSAGSSFSVPANSSFEIEVKEPIDYVCHFN
jgi:hypothetical protein